MVGATLSSEYITTVIEASSPADCDRAIHLCVCVCVCVCVCKCVCVCLCTCVQAFTTKQEESQIHNRF